MAASLGSNSSERTQPRSLPNSLEWTCSSTMSLADGSTINAYASGSSQVFALAHLVKESLDSARVAVEANMQQREPAAGPTPHVRDRRPLSGRSASVLIGSCRRASQHSLSALSASSDRSSRVPSASN